MCFGCSRQLGSTTLKCRGADFFSLAIVSAALLLVAATRTTRTASSDTYHPCCLLLGPNRTYQLVGTRSPVFLLYYHPCVMPELDSIFINC
jgi:hypothetical protein